MKKIALIAIYLLCSLMVNAQWRIGITGGATYNHYTIDNHYMSDWHYEGTWGGTAGMIGQYDFNDWFGIRADLNWAMKNHEQYRYMFQMYYEIRNNYIQLPVMASFYFGSKKIRGFLNAGIYGGYWLSSYNYGIQTFPISSNIKKTDPYKIEFVEERDQRYDYGFVGGIGIEWRFTMFKKDWTWQLIEARVYYSTQSTQKDYMKIKDPRYNTTLALQSGFCYFF